MSFFGKRKSSDKVITDEERIARYVYLLNTLPPAVVEIAHAKAFEDVPPERRREMFEQLKPFMSEEERSAASDDPTVLASLVRRAEERRAHRSADGKRADAAPPAAAATGEGGDPRDAVDPRALMQESGIITLVASQFLVSSAITMYFSHGAGSLDLADEPSWIVETFDPGAAGYDGTDLGGGVVGGFNGGGSGGGWETAGL